MPAIGSDWSCALSEVTVYVIMRIWCVGVEETFVEESELCVRIGQDVGRLFRIDGVEKKPSFACLRWRCGR